jgi:hypothetical protein
MQDGGGPGTPGKIATVPIEVRLKEEMRVPQRLP